MSGKSVKDFVSDDFLNIKFNRPKIRKNLGSFEMSREAYLKCLKSSTKSAIAQANHFLKEVESELSDING